jgi:Protein of unknown function (DUF2934)
MQTILTEKVRERAYALWQAAGMVDGRDLDHWCAAEREVLGPTEERSTPAPRRQSRPRKSAARRV